MQSRILCALSVWFLCSFSLSGQEIYLSTLNGLLYTLNLEDCSYDLIGNMPVSSTDISFHPNGNLYAVNGSGTLFEVNVSAGTSTQLHTFEPSASQLYTALTIDANGVFYACGLAGDLWAYDLDSDTGTYLGNVGYGAEGDLTFYNGDLYMAAVNDNIVLVDIDDPGNSSIYINGNVAGRIFGIVSYAATCEEVQTFALTDNAADIYQIDYATNSLSLYCSIPLAVSGGASSFEFFGSNPVEIEEVAASGFNCQDSDGSIMVTATGGIGALSYSIDGMNYQSSPNFSGLSGDEYIVYVQDEVGCIVDEPVDLGLALPEIIDVEVVNASCGEDNGSLSLVIDNGSPPYAISLNNGPFVAATDFPSLAPGFYAMTVMDDNGCVNTSMASIGSSGQPTFAEVIVDQPTCGENNGAISFTAIGGLAPFTYELNGNPIMTTELQELSPGTYNVQLTDEAGCVAQETIVLAESSGVIIESVGTTDTSCGEANGTVQVTASGGEAPYFYFLDDLENQTAPNFVNVPSGTYELSVFDRVGCGNTTQVQIGGSEPLLLFQESITAATCQENDGLFTYEWSGGTGELSLRLNGQAQVLDNELEDLAAGDYQLIISDSLACADTLSFNLPRSSCPIYLPNAFSPNSDGINDQFRPYATGDLDATVLRFALYDRWGGLVYEATDRPINDPGLGWNGRRSGEPLPQGVFVYFLETVDANGEASFYSGDVLLLR